MEEAATAGAIPIHRGLPDEIAIWEILVRLPPKCLLRCRAVCRAWRLATSTRNFLLAHHGRQPTLPLLLNQGSGSVDIIPFDHRAGLTATEQLQPVARLRGSYSSSFTRKVSCDGIIVKSCHDKNFMTFNPATRQYASLEQLNGFCLLGMYRHIPTGEYRLLLYPGYNRPYDIQDGSFVFTLGSSQPPRHIGYPGMDEELVFAPVSTLFRGNLHWHVPQHEGANNNIMVFDTTSESFRLMRAPLAPVIRGNTTLFEMGDMLGMAIDSHASTIINIWGMQDYEGEVWTFKHRVELPVADIRVKFENFKRCSIVVAASSDGDLLVLVRLKSWVLHVDVDGKLVASFHGTCLYPTDLRLKQTLVSHTFFQTLVSSYGLQCV